MSAPEPKPITFNPEFVRACRAFNETLGRGMTDFAARFAAAVERERVDTARRRRAAHIPRRGDA